MKKKSMSEWETLTAFLKKNRFELANTREDSDNDIKQCRSSPKALTNVTVMRWKFIAHGERTYRNPGNFLIEFYLIVSNVDGVMANAGRYSSENIDSLHNIYLQLLCPVMEIEICFGRLLCAGLEGFSTCKFSWP